MSAGSPHHRPHTKRPEQLAALEAEPEFRAMWARPYRVDETYEIADTGGYSVAGDVYYLDRDFVAAVMAGVWTNPKTGRAYRVAVTRMTPQQILQCILRHERVEKCMLDADNTINTYEEAHEYATSGEHQAVRLMDASPTEYEFAIEAIMEWNEIKPLTNVPRDLSCAPYLDRPDANDKRALKEMRQLGVLDAHKLSRKSVNYRSPTGTERCGLCNQFQGPSELATCDRVEGLVRDNRYCERFKSEKKDEDIFVSYKREDRDHVELLVKVLRGEGWTTFWDPHILPGTANWDMLIERKLYAAKCIVVVWSRRAIKSEYVRTEAHYGRNKRILVAVTIDGTVPATFALNQTVDLSGWSGGKEDERIAKILRGIGELMR